MHQMGNLLGHLASEQRVFARKKLELRKEVEDLLPEALSKIDAEGRRFICEVVTFNYTIGKSTCVTTSSDDDGNIVFAKRPWDDGLTRFVKNREPELSNKMYIILKKMDDKRDYILIKATIGDAMEPEIWDEKSFDLSEVPGIARSKSNEFWSSHAIVWDSEKIAPESVVIVE